MASAMMQGLMKAGKNTAGGFARGAAPQDKKRVVPLNELPAEGGVRDAPGLEARAANPLAILAGLYDCGSGAFDVVLKSNIVNEHTR